MRRFRSSPGRWRPGTRPWAPAATPRPRGTRAKPAPRPANTGPGRWTSCSRASDTPSGSVTSGDSPISATRTAAVSFLFFLVFLTNVFGVFFSFFLASAQPRTAIACQIGEKSSHQSVDGNVPVSWSYTGRQADLPGASFLNDLPALTSWNWLVKGGVVSAHRSKSAKAPGPFASFHCKYSSCEGCHSQVKV